MWFVSSSEGIYEVGCFSACIQRHDPNSTTNNNTNKNNDNDNYNNNNNNNNRVYAFLAVNGRTALPRSMTLPYVKRCGSQFFDVEMCRFM